MPKILIHHVVDDLEHWLAAPTRAEFFGQLGITDIQTFSDPQNPTHVGLTMHVPDMDAFAQALQSDQAAAAMKADGVHGDTVTVLVEA